MLFGAVFPQTEIGPDRQSIRDYAQTVEGLGYSHIVAYDHVLGVDTTHRPDWRGYTYRYQFHEPFVLFGYLAALTQLELVSGVIILPQRQTALVAKQAAEVDVLSNGKMRLGIGVGWNPVEYEALGMDFHQRGRMVEEQIEVLRENRDHYHVFAFVDGVRPDESFIRASLSGVSSGGAKGERAGE